mgnify:CR=1 FL=1
MWLFQREQDRKFKIAKEAAINSALELSKKTLEEYVAYIPKMSYSKMYRLIDNKTKEKRAENSFIFVNQAFYKNIALMDTKVEIKKCFIPPKEELIEKEIYVQDIYEASNRLCYDS